MSATGRPTRPPGSRWTPSRSVASSWSTQGSGWRAYENPTRPSISRPLGGDEDPQDDVRDELRTGEQAGQQEQGAHGPRPQSEPESERGAHARQDAGRVGAVESVHALSVP